MSTLRFSIQDVPFSAIPVFGSGSAFERLRTASPIEAGFPRWTPENVNHVSSWPERKQNEAIEMISKRNPHLAPLPLNARFVVAGQQAGLLTGPLYAFLKAVSVIGLSREIERQSDGPVIPLFWIASEDHDILEVNRVRVNGKWFVQEYKGELRRGAVPQVADISIQEAREPILEFLRVTLPPTEFTEEILDTVASSDFSNYETSFFDLMRSWFSEWGLRLIDPRSLRPLTSPVLASLVEQWPDVVSALHHGGETVRSEGFEPPLNYPGVFEIVEGKRVGIEFDHDKVETVRGKMSLKDLASEIRRRPFDFSPNAALRPVAQDAVLPVVATLGGPSELVYLWQIDPIYRVAGVERSRLCPRISATFIETKIQRAAEKTGLWPHRIFEVHQELDDASYLNSVTDDEETAQIDQKGRELLEAIDALKEKDIWRWLEKNWERLSGQIEKIVTRLREEQNQEVKMARSRLEKIDAAILPEGGPQERSVNPIEFLNLYGNEFVRLSVKQLNPVSDGHQVVLISTESE